MSRSRALAGAQTPWLWNRVRARLVSLRGEREAMRDRERIRRERKLRERRLRERRLVEWLWRKVETAAVMAALVCVWVWINSPPTERARRRPARGTGVETPDHLGEGRPPDDMFERVHERNHAQHA